MLGCRNRHPVANNSKTKLQCHFNGLLRAKIRSSFEAKPVWVNIPEATFSPVNAGALILTERMPCVLEVNSLFFR